MYLFNYAGWRTAREVRGKGEDDEKKRMMRREKGGGGVEGGEFRLKERER